MRKNRKAFTIAELMVTVVLFFLFSSSIMGILLLALNSWEEADARVSAQQNARLSASTIISDLKQAIVNPDPGHSPYAATGYISISPAVAPTAVLFPNANTTSGSYLTFTEPNTANYNPSATGWDPLSPDNYQKVKYYTSGGQLIRQVTKYNAAGQAQTPTEIPIAQVSSGTLSLTAQYLDFGLFRVTVSSTEKVKGGGNVRTSSYSSSVYLPSK